MTRATSCTIAIAIVAAAAPARQSTGTIHGTVIDAQGGGGPGATIVIRHQPTAVARSVLSEVAGGCFATLLRRVRPGFCGAES